MHALFTLFQVLKVLLIKNREIQQADVLFLVVFISFYISRYHFSQIFRTSYTLSKKIFSSPFLTDSHKAPAFLTRKIC